MWKSVPARESKQNHASHRVAATLRYEPEEWQGRSVALQDAARDIAKAHFCVAPHFTPPKRVPTTFRAPSVSLLLRTPDCVLTNPEDVAEEKGQPRLKCDGDDGDGDGGGGKGAGGGGAGGGGSSGTTGATGGTGENIEAGAADGNVGGSGGSSTGAARFLRVQTRRHPASFTRKHVTRPEYVGPSCKLSACFAAGLFPGARPESEKEDGYLGDDFLAVLSTRCGNPIERVLARKKWVIPLIG